MLFSLLYFLVRRLLGAGSRLQDEKDIELLVLRHELKVLQRQVKRPRLHRLDRVLLAAASRAMTRSIWSSFVVRPETLLHWHRELVGKKWTYRRRGHPGRTPIEPEHVLTRSDADRAALIGQLHLRDDAAWLSELLIEIESDPDDLTRLKLIGALQVVLN
jgi:hypothetical protein